MRFPVAASLAVLAVLPAAAAAAPVAVEPLSGRTAAGPVLGPGGKVLVATNADDGILTLTGAVPGSAPATLARVAPHDKEPHLVVDEIASSGLAASPTRVALDVHEDIAGDPDFFDTLWEQALTGDGTGPLTAAAGTTKSRTVFGLDLSGDRLATIEAPTDKQPRDLLIRDLAHPGPAVVLAHGIGGQIALAGGWVAYRAATGTVVVASSVTGAEAYRVAVPTEVDALALQPDGTLALLLDHPGGNPSADVAWASPAAPALHPLAAGVGIDVLRIAGGHVLYARPNAKASELALSDIATGAAQAVSFPAPYLSGADYDGTRIAYATPDCVYADTVGATPPAAPAAHTCGSFRESTVGLSGVTRRGGGASVSCVVAPDAGCQGRLTIRTAPGATSHPVTVAAKTYDIARGGRASLDFRLPKKLLARLKRAAGRHASIALVAVARDSGGATTTSTRSLLRVR